MSTSSLTASATGLGSGRATGKRSTREAIERRMQDMLAGLGGDRGADARMEGIRAAFGVAAEGFPFGDTAVMASADGICDLIEANLETSPLVACLQPGDGQPPLFLIHAGAGYVFFYRALASHLTPRPVYGIRAETAADRLGHRFDRWQSIEALAAHYIALMKAIQPHGPYAVGGGSFGGTVAFEMARQLVAGGDRVRAVLMFCPELLTGQDGALAGGGLTGRVGFHLNVASTLAAPQAVQYLSRKVLSNAGSEALAVLRKLRPAPRTIRPDRHEPAVAVHRLLAPEFAFRCSVNMRTAARLLTKYVPQPYGQPVTLFRAAGDRDRLPQWQRVARGGIELHDVPGGHLELLEEPYVDSVAAVVRRHIV